MKNFKKLFAIVATAAMLTTMVNTSTFAAGYSDELQGAYDYAYGIGVTTQSTIDSANMYGNLIRSHMAKMMVNYAKEVLGQTPDTSVEVNFTDIADQSSELQGYIVEAAQMGLMGLNADGTVAEKFNPTGVVTRAQFGTVLSRVLYGDANNGSTPYYKAHLEALKDAGIMTKIDTPEATEVRGYVMLMLMRAADGTESATCSTPDVILACTLGTSACPAECEDEVVTPNAEGNLTVKLASSEGRDVPYSVPALEVATYKFTADEDVRIDSVTFKMAGYADNTTLDGVALYVDGARVSKLATFNSDEESTANITNGYTIKAGSSVEFAVKVNVATGTAGDQFSLKIKSVSSTAKEVDLASDLTSDTFKVVDRANKSVVYADATVDQPKLGQEDADLFDFSLNNSTADQDATLKSITFKQGTGDVDYATDLKNYSLVVYGETIATTDSLNGKYLTFNVDGGYLIKDGKNPTFTVKADVIGGAGKKVNFFVEKSSDVVVIGDTYDVPLTNNAEGNYTPTATISAGKVAIAKVNTAASDLVGNKDNIFFGAFTITNNADQELALKSLSVSFAGNTGVLDNVKVKLGSTSASPVDLTNSAGTWSETDLDKAIGSKLTVYVYGDTIDTGMDSKSLKMTLSAISIEETQNDETVTDITPSSLTWSNMNGSTSNVTLTNVALGDKTVSEGTEAVEAISFKIKAGTVYATKIKQITFDGTKLSTTGTALDSDTVTAATLYNGTTEIPATVKNGTIVVDDDFTIAVGTTATLTLKVDVASNPEATAFKYSLSGAKVDAVEVSDDADDVIIGGSTISGRRIDVVGAGEIQRSYETTADNNKYAKDILAGNSAVVAEYSLYTKYETANVGSGLVTFSKDLSGSALDVQLYYGDKMVASNPEWSTDGKTAIFEDIDFNTNTAKTALTVKVVSKVIDDNGGIAVANATVNSITLGDVKGNDSGEDIIANTDIIGTSKAFNIVPVTITPAVTSVGTTKGDFSVVANNGTNTESNGDESKATLNKVYFSVDGNNSSLLSLDVKDDAGNSVLSSAITVAGANGTFTGTFAPSTVLSNGGSTTYTVSVTVSGSINTPSYNVSLKGIDYTANSASLSANFGASKTIISK